VVHDSRDEQRVQKHLETPKNTNKSKNVDQDDDEVQIVAEIQSPEMQFNPSGHSTILGNTAKKIRPFFHFNR